MLSSGLRLSVAIGLVSAATVLGVSTVSAVPVGISGGASGTTVAAAGGLVTYGPTPSVTLPPDGTAQSASTTAGSVPGAVSTGATTVSTSGVPATGAVTSASEVNGANLATVDVVTGDVQASCSVGLGGPKTQASVLRFSTGGTPTDLTSNTTQVTPIAGGTVTYDETSTSSAGGVESATVTALHVHFTAGGDVYVGRASCGGPVVAVGPVVSGVAPSDASSGGGSVVTVTGSGFGGPTGVSFGGTPASGFTVNSAGSLSATAPAHTPGPVDVTVTGPGGTSPIGAADVFSYHLGATAPPTIVAVSPQSGPIVGGTPVAITGTGFTGASSVAFGGVPATALVVNSDGSLSAVAPAHGAGSVDVTVTNPGGVNPTGAQDVFTYNGPSNLSGVSVAVVTPDSGPVSGGTPVVITGTGFTGATGVGFGGTPATAVVVNSDTSISAVAPGHAAGPVDVTVTTPAGTSPIAGGDAFSYSTLPVVAAVTPRQGGPASAVTISGTGLSGATGVTFGATPASGFTVNPDGTITAIAPTAPPRYCRGDRRQPSRVQSA